MAAEWVRYRRLRDRPLEAMHAHFRRHVYHRHSHETYSFGVTEAGAQQFTCRGGRHTSAAGMVMAFNPEDPHDGQAAIEPGFTYHMVHIGPELLSAVLDEDLGRRPALPLFASPVLRDAGAVAALSALHRALMTESSMLERDERLAAAVGALVRRATRVPAAAGPPPAASARVASRVRDELRARPFDDIGAADLAAAAGQSRFAVYRAFRAAYGLPPSDYQRQLRLREARSLLAAGAAPAAAAVATGFADQAHLHRWFVRCFGLTPGAFRRAVREL